MMNVSQLENLESSGEELVDLGLQPVSNRFLAPNSLTEVPRFPLKLNICKNTGLVHLSKPFPVDELKPRYDWLTCFEPEAHLDDLAEKITRLPGINQDSVIGAYSFKDDSTLQRLKNLGYNKTWCIDPAQDLDITDNCANVETWQSVVTPAKSEKIRERYGAADVLVVRHVLEHAFNLPGFIQFIKLLIKPDGYIVWEIPDCERALGAGDCTTIWEEHIFYFTSCSFKQLLYASGFGIVHYESVPYVLENSIIAIVQNTSSEVVIPDIDKEKIDIEVNRARNFVETITQRRKIIRKKLEDIRRNKGSIAIFGAGHLSVAFLSLMGVADLIRFVVDDNPNKKGLLMPVGNLKIVGSEALYSEDISVCILGLNPENQPAVMKNNIKFAEQGGIFTTIFPSSEIDIERVL
jgi:hypothetical protein